MLITDMQAMGDKIYRIRKAAGLSQEEAAWQAGISDRAFADIERGATTPRVDSLIKICRVLRVTPNDLLTEDEPEDALSPNNIMQQLELLPPRDMKTACNILDAYVRSVKETL